ncbi:MAG: MarR family transcriptional regulator [Actinomycetota bacterium]|jgi:DNA-binding MarR family transcriptional regulator|nr:MarR family transcriptional regulator [Actinomycetota bacterium]MDA8357104.1 MarR family transcriptional regulator [Actinomycetota bacterium]
MAGELHALGHEDYRRSDALALRVLQRGPMSIGRLGDALGVTRQAARKVANGLERRGLATTARDSEDARQVNLILTEQGQAYARAIVVVIERLNRDLSMRVRAEELAAAEVVLRAVLTDRHARSVAQHPSGPDPSRIGDAGTEE